MENMENTTCCPAREVIDRPNITKKVNTYNTYVSQLANESLQYTVTQS